MVECLLGAICLVYNIFIVWFLIPKPIHSSDSMFCFALCRHRDLKCQQLFPKRPTQAQATINSAVIPICKPLTSLQLLQSSQPLLSYLILLNGYLFGCHFPLLKILHISISFRSLSINLSTFTESSGHHLDFEVGISNILCQVRLEIIDTDKESPSKVLSLR